MNSHAELAIHLIERVPGLALPWRCPLCEGTSAHRGTLALVVMHLVDTHHQPREWIADWLDTLDVDLTVRDAPVWELTPLL